MTDVSKIIIVTGMGRSGTSLVASFFHKAGFSMGSRMPEADQHNRHGYYEDLDFVNFHETVLRRYGRDYYATSEEPIVLTGEETAMAHAIVASRSSYAAWGWKDPRTAFLLDFWDQELDQARFVFLYRHPIEVCLSQLRSHTWVDSPATIIKSWITYNKKILEFFPRHKNKCILCNIHGLINSIDLFEQALDGRFKFKLTISQQNFRPPSLHSFNMPESFQEIFTVHCPEAKAIYDALEEQADLRCPDCGKARDEDFRDLIEYACDVLNTTLVNQSAEHLKLAAQHQELRELYRQLSERFTDYERSIEESEAFHIARLIVNSSFFKAVKRLMGR